MEQELKQLGLTDYEIKAYLGLISSGLISANDLSRRCKVPQGKIYATLEKLVDKGLVNQLDTRPKRFRAVDPKLGITNLVNSKAQVLKELSGTLPAVINEFTKAKFIEKTDERISLFSGRENSFAPLRSMQEKAEKTIDLMFTFEVVTAEDRRILYQKKREGLKIRIIATKTTGIKYIREFQNAGFVVRYYPVEELRISAVDNRQSVIMILNKGQLNDRTSIFIDSIELTKALVHYFDSVWKKAKEI